MKTLFTNVNQIKRRYSTVLPLSRIGFLFPCRPQKVSTFTNKLELCLRLSSGTSCAEDIIDGVAYRTPFPHVVLKLPDSIHTYDVETGREAVYLQYPPEQEEALRKAGLLDKPRIWPVCITPEIRTQLHRLRELLDRLLEPGAIDRIDLAAMELFEMLVEQDGERGALSGELEARIGRIATYFHLHFTEEIDMERLLKENSFSRRNFFRCWSRLHESGPAEYIRELRLNHAAGLLAETTLPIDEIARRVNFCNSSYLIRLFRARFGTTPLRYRTAAQTRRPPGRPLNGG